MSTNGKHTVEDAAQLLFALLESQIGKRLRSVGIKSGVEVHQQIIVVEVKVGTELPIGAMWMGYPVTKKPWSLRL